MFKKLLQEVDNVGDILSTDIGDILSTGVNNSVAHLLSDLLLNFAFTLSNTYCCLSQKHQWSKSVGKRCQVFTEILKFFSYRGRQKKKCEILSSTFPAKDRKRFRQLHLWSSPKKCTLIPKGREKEYRVFKGIVSGRTAGQVEYIQMLKSYQKTQLNIA